MPEKRIVIELAGARLEGVLQVPAGGPHPGAVICHPHPQFGGDMHNNVVIGVQDALEAAGFATLRYNVRGMGRSEGVLAGPDVDTEDLIMVAEYFAGQSGVDRDKISLTGYSYGSIMALLASKKARASVAFSPPVGMFDMEFISEVTTPLLVVCGDRDQFCPLDKLRKLLPDKAKLEILKGVDHFYMGAENEAGRLAAGFLSEHMG